jgi:DNA topoisomerase-2
MKISDFYKTEYVDYSSYDNLRKIASLVDGQKNASRKILYTLLEKNIKEKVKVSQLSSKIEEFSEYLHGSLEDVVVNAGQDFVGSNNIALVQKSGNFGTRFTPEASASRYIHAYGSKAFFELFNKQDTPILRHQTFEGHKIEPMFFVPKLPLLLINGSEGVSSGFAQKIRPRDPKQITKYIKSKLEGRNPSVKIIPWFRGFNGTIEQGENDSQWLINGVVKRVGVNRVQITEVPIGYNLKSYISVLDKLEEKNIIQSYRDKSENDVFLFDINIQSKVLKMWSDEELLLKLKLQKKVTENYTVLNENNKIQVFDSAKDILDSFIKIKLEYVELRKLNLIDTLEQEIELDNSKYLFIQAIVTDSLKINKRKKADIIKDLEKIEGVVQKDGSYDYLLGMNILSLTDERLIKLKSDIKERKEKMNELKKQKPSEIWANEL